MQDNINGNKSKNIDMNEKIANLLTEMEHSENNLTPILRESMVRDCSKTSFYKGKIKCRKSTSQVIAKLMHIFPLNNFNHLKRVRESDVLICSCTLSKEEVKEKLRRDDLFDLLEEEITCIEVPSEAPILRWQYEIAQKMWPCNFHPNKYFEKLTGGSFFEKDEIRRHRTYMRIAYEIGSLVDDKSEDKCDAIESIKRLKATIIVDPKINSVVSAGCDRRNWNPCQHQVMVAIDNVAKTQNGGVWFTNSSDITPEGIPKTVIERYPSIRFGARPYAPKKRNLQQVEPEECGPYICTGYDVYTTNEPCIMCSMALVHARVSRVFFALENRENGGLVSKCKLHDVKDLNHHYDVFTGFFPNKSL